MTSGGGEWGQPAEVDAADGIPYNAAIIWAGRKALVQPWAGTFSPPFFLSCERNSMSILSVFIDESGDFGLYEAHSPYYIICLLMHDQDKDITSQINHLKRHVVEMGFEENHAIHSAPLIRREKDYECLDMPARRKLFRYLLTFMRLCDIRYKTFAFKKRESVDHDALVSRMSKEIGAFVRENLEFFQAFDEIVVYYDGGQKEITNIINAVFNVLLDADIRRVIPSDYRLFQAADMACTLELLDIKYHTHALSQSEREFFRGERNLYKNNLKTAYSKRF